MSVACPHCGTDNTQDSEFCKKCGSQIGGPKTKPVPTQTLETPREELTTGSTFAGRYQIIEELGRGGMGRVYKAQDTELKEKVALKLISPDVSADKNTVERFQNELRIARKIVHQNVGRMYDLGKEEGRHFITMEYVEGQDLKSLIRQSRQLTIGTAVSIAIQVAEGLAEAHRLGVVHRDLKPGNIMIDRDGNARIMDFGIARSLKEKGITGAGVMIGTPEYMSPEQVEGKETDQRTDIYALGVILYEMVTGRVPFEGDTALAIAVKHKTEAPKDPREFNSQICEELSRIILRCLEKDKEKRPQSAGELRSELESIEKGMPTTERVVAPKKTRPSKEITVTFGLKKVVVPALAFFGIVIIGVIIWRLLPKRKTVAAPQIENSVAVISFKNQTGDKTYDYLQEAIPNLLITSLENTGYLHVATWERLRDLLAQSGRRDKKLIDETIGFELCRREGIESIVLGSVIKAGETFATDVKVLDVRSKRLLRSASSRGDGVDSIINIQIDELKREITRGVGISKKKVAATQIRISESAMSSMEAYENFLRGSEAYDNFYFDDAREFLEKAIELDPAFAMAYLYLASVYHNLRDYDARDGAIKKAQKYAEKASERERLYIGMNYARRIEKDEEKRFRILEEIARKYPREKRAYYSLGDHYLSIDVSKAIEYYNKALDLDPNYGLVWNKLGFVYSDLGDFQKAIECFQEYASLSPWDANPVDSIAELHYRMGRLDLAAAKYEEALAIKPDFGSGFKIAYICALREEYDETLRWIGQFTAQAPSPGLKHEGDWWESFYFFWLGKTERSLDRLQRVVDDRNASGYGKMAVNYLRGWVHYDCGNLDLSQDFFKKCYNFLKDYRPGAISDDTADYNFFLGLIALKQGRSDAARSRLKEMESLFPKRLWKNEGGFHIAHLKAEILLAEGEPQEAIIVCEQAGPRDIPAMNAGSIATYNMPFMRDTLARAYVQMDDLDSAISEYERILTFDPEGPERRLIHPRLHYRLAKLYEVKGRKEEAIEQYQKFLDIWKEADPGIAEVEDSRQRLAELESKDP
jgi:serine/threonine protein kinase/tetratricopeptide (TPR) repeat protein